MVGWPALALCISRVMLFIKDNDAQVGQRREERGTPPDHYIDLASANTQPLIIAFSRCERAVDNGNSTWKAACETLDSLRGKSNLRYKHDAAFALRNDCRQCLEINLSFTTTRDTMEEDGGDG